MGNCPVCCKRCHCPCQDAEDTEWKAEDTEWKAEDTEPEKNTEEEIPSHKQQAIYDYPTMKLTKGDILEVFSENNEWMYVRKCTRNGASHKGFEKIFIPKGFLRPVDSLEARQWYFENIKKRFEAKRCLLRPENADGAFLVWKSIEKNCFFLSVKDGLYARHYRIKEQEADKNFYLVERKLFKTISELVESYFKDPDGLCARLTGPCIMLDKPAPSNLSPDEHLEVDKASLTKIKKIGKGEFGEVWHGKWRNKIDVAIKEFRVISPAIQTEIEIMQELHHEHLLKLYGVCTKSEPFCIITELMKNGSLKNFLIGHRQKNDVDFSLMMDFSVQITEGMAYLESKNIVHRDLRADNILLSEMLSCKIADFGLAQYTFASNLTIASSVKIPVKWMAPEIFTEMKYSTKCDVWSFGILLTEIITYANEPYQGKSNIESIQAIKKGYRMEQPPDCPPQLYQVMLHCWRAKPEERPAFAELQETLSALIRESNVELDEDSVEINCKS